VEQDGTWVNYEGRAQSSYQVFQPVPSIRAAWEWLTPVDPLSPSAPGSETLLHALALESVHFAGLHALQPLRSGIALGSRRTVGKGSQRGDLALLDVHAGGGHVGHGERDCRSRWVEPGVRAARDGGGGLCRQRGREAGDERGNGDQ
jgi:hypothetical protein